MGGVRRDVDVRNPWPDAVERKTRRQHADDHVRFGIHLHQPADNRGVGTEVPAPESVAEHDHCGRPAAAPPGRGVGVHEEPTERRPHADDIEERRFDADSRNALGFGAPGDLKRAFREGRDGLEAPAPRADVHQGRNVWPVGRPIGLVAFDDHDQAIRLGERHRPEHDRMHAMPLFTLSATRLSKWNRSSSSNS